MPQVAPSGETIQVVPTVDTVLLQEGIPHISYDLLEISNDVKMFFELRDWKTLWHHWMSAISLMKCAKQLLHQSGWNYTGGTLCWHYYTGGTIFWHYTGDILYWHYAGGTLCSYYTGGASWTHYRWHPLLTLPATIATKLQKVTNDKSRHKTVNWQMQMNGSKCQITMQKLTI